MKNIVGNWVEGPDFFDRVEDLARLQQEAMRHDLLVLAPRRVGKTSLLHRFATEVESTEGMHAVYADVQGARDERDFLRKLAEAIESHPSKPWAKLRRLGRRLRSMVAKTGSVTLGPFSLSLDDTTEDDWLRRARELEDALRGLPGHWFFLLDEVPVLVLRLLAKEDGPRRARDFLGWWRGLRLSPTDDVETRHWILAGSIGLDTVAARHEMSASINDLATFRLGPFASIDARAFLRKLSDAEALPLAPEALDRIIERIGWLIPFHLQLVFGKLRERHQGKRAVANAVVEVDAAIDETLRERKDFASWYERLGDELGEHSARHAEKILAACATDPTGARDDTLDAVLAAETPDVHERARERRYLLDVLETDGYLVRDGDRWRFASPLLREFWVRRYA